MAVFRRPRGGVSRWLRKAWTFLASVRLAVLIVVGLILVSLAGTLLPQASTLPETDLNVWRIGHPLTSAVADRLGLFRAFSSWLFIGLLAALSVSLVACTADRVASRRRSRAGGRALVGSLVLHAGLLVVLAGGVVTAGYRFDGTVLATEGQVLDLSGDAYLRLVEGPFLAEKTRPAVTLELESFAPRYQGPTPVALDSTLRVRSGDGRERTVTVQVNRPVRFDGLVFTQAGHGFSPSVVVVSPQGVPVVDAFVALRSQRGSDQATYEDYVDAPGLPNRLVLRVFPDLSLEDGRPVSRSFVPRNPFLLARFVDRRGETISQTLVRLGESAELGGFNVTFRDLRYWSAFRVTRDVGRFVVFAGFGLCLLGAVIRYLPRRAAGSPAVGTAGAGRSA